jgi:hypothetical protein
MARNSPQSQFLASLAGGSEVPPVATSASGAALLGAVPGQQAIRVRVSVASIIEVTVAQIQLGQSGENGPVIVHLYGSHRPPSFEKDADLVDRVVTAAHLTGPLQGLPLVSLVEQILDGNAYVNLLTVQNPEGEIRGQIVPIRT